MNNLLDLAQAADRVAIQQSNLERLDESGAYTRTPTRIGGALNTIVGPPVAGTWPLYQVFVDSTCQSWLCTAAGTPGTWRRIDPPVVEQQAYFFGPGAIASGSYVGGRYKFAVPMTATTAQLICTAPAGASVSFTLEVDGVLTALVLTIASGASSGTLDLGALAIAAGKYIRWKCTDAPGSGSASNIHLVTTLNT